MQLKQGNLSVEPSNEGRRRKLQLINTEPDSLRKGIALRRRKRHSTPPCARGSGKAESFVFEELVYTLEEATCLIELSVNFSLTLLRPSIPHQSIMCKSSFPFGIEQHNSSKLVTLSRTLRQPLEHPEIGPSASSRPIDMFHSSKTAAVGLSNVVPANRGTSGPEQRGRRKLYGIEDLVLLSPAQFGHVCVPVTICVDICIVGHPASA
ncbi:hypothetical protein VNO77_20132 [Canavalia gladiata]|uniref:Uncharacterized protein n=1 Tax=Canavalia gladiata TaxID=3824 RepID=A0AAN9LNX4_CANGL